MKKILPFLVVALVAAGSVAAYQMSHGLFSSSEDYVEAGKRAFEERQYAEAALHFANAIQKDERNRDALFFLARTVYAQGNIEAATKNLKAILAVFPDDIGANLELGHISLTAGAADSTFFKVAAGYAQKVLARDANNVTAHLLAANAAVGLQDFQRSREHYEKALSLDPQNIPAILSYGTSQALQKNYDEAEKSFLKARELAPKEPSVLVTLGQFYDVVNQVEKAEAAFREALAGAPGKKEVYLPAAAMYFRRSRFNEGAAILKAAEAGNPGSLEPSLALYDLYQGKRLTGESEKVVLDLRKRFPDNAQVALKTAAHYLPNKPELARTAIDDVLKKDPKDPQALALLGELQYIAGQDTEAQATLSSPDLIQSPLAKPHFLLGSIAARRGQLDVAQGEYRKALTKDPRYLAASLALADLLLIRNNTLAARAEIVKALATQPDNPEARLIKATIDRIDKQYPEAERELLRLVKEQPDNPLVYRQLGLYFEARGKTSEAEKSFARALELQPDSPGMLQEAAFFHVRARQSDRAIQLIDRVSAGKTQAFQDELAGIIYAQAGKTREADAAFRKAVEKEPGRLSAMNFLAGLHFEAGRHDEALEWLNESLRKNPSQPKTLAIRGAILQSKGNLEGAKKDYALALEGDPKLGATANNLAYLLAEEGRDLPTALKWSQVAQSNQPDNPSAADTLGWIHYKLGNYDLAREQLQIAVARQPANGVYQYHLGMALKAAQRNAEAQAALTKAATSASDSRERTLAQAELKQWGAKP